MKIKLVPCIHWTHMNDSHPHPDKIIGNVIELDSDVHEIHVDVRLDEPEPGTDSLPPHVTIYYCEKNAENDRWFNGRAWIFLSSKFHVIKGDTVYINGVTHRMETEDDLSVLANDLHAELTLEKVCT